MPGMPRRRPGRGRRHAGQVSEVSRLAVAAVFAAVGAAVVAGPMALIWLAGVGGWLRFTAACVIVGVSGPYVARHATDG